MIKDCTGDDTNPAVLAAQKEFVALVKAARTASEPFDWGRLAEFRFTGLAAASLIETVRGLCDGVVVAGQVVGDIVVSGFEGDITVTGEVLGQIIVAESVSGDIRVRDGGDVQGLDVRADVRGGIRIGRRGVVRGPLKVGLGATVEEVWIGGAAAQVGAVDVEEGHIREALSITEGASIAGDVVLSGAEVRSVVIAGATIGGNLRIAGQSTVFDVLVSTGVRIGGDLDLLRSSVTGDVGVEGHIDGAVRLQGRVDGRVDLIGWARAVDLKEAALRGDVAISSVRTAPVVLMSATAARFGRSVHIGDGVSIVECDFRQCGDLDKLDLVGADLFKRRDGSQATALGKPDGASDGEMASIYRQLRVNLEGKGNRPASAFFYRGEMDSRRRAARGGRRWGEWAWISLYRWVAGYGLRVAPPLLWFAVLVGLGAWGFHALDLGRPWPDTVVYTAQTMLSLFRPPDQPDDWAMGLLQIVLRVLGPILLGLAAFAARDKVAR